MEHTDPDKLARRPRFFALALVAALGVSGAAVAGIANVLQPHILESRPAEQLPWLDEYWVGHDDNQLLLIHWKMDTDPVNWTRWPYAVNGWELPSSDYTLDPQAKHIAFSSDARLLPDTRAVLLLEDGEGVTQLYVFNTEIRLRFENAHRLIQGSFKLLPAPDVLEISPAYEIPCRMASGASRLPPDFLLEVEAGEVLDLGFTPDRAEGFPAAVGECRPLQMTIINEGIWSR